MIWGALRMWWHCLWRLHRMETCSIGPLPIGFDCGGGIDGPCGVHFWHSERHNVEYLAVRAAFPRRQSIMNLARCPHGYDPTLCSQCEVKELKSKLSTALDRLDSTLKALRKIAMVQLAPSERTSATEWIKDVASNAVNANVVERQNIK